MNYNHSNQGRLAAAASQHTKEKEYWLAQLSGEPVKVGFPPDYKKSAGQKRHLQQVEFRLTDRVFSRLNWLCGDSDYTLHVYLAAGIILLLNKYTCHQDIIIGTPIYKQDIEGKFINTVLPLRSRIHDRMNFKQLILQLSETVVEAVEHQSYPLELICSQLKIKYPEISVFFNMSGFGERNRQNLENFESFHTDFVQDAKFDMVCYLTEYKNGIQINTHYYKQLFKPGKIEKMMRLYLQILEKISRCPGEKVSTFSKPERKLKIKL